MNEEVIGQRLRWFAWLVAGLVLSIAIIRWGQYLGWNFANLTAYEIFPLLGLMAFGLMLSHYIVAVARLRLGISKVATKNYFEYTSWVVLALILLHPGLMIWQLYRDGLGLPPGSYLSVYGWVAMLGTISLVIFLVYELRRWYGGRSWWKYISGLSDVAMLLVFYHGLTLGSLLQEGWFRITWYAYGVILIGSLAYIYAKKFKKSDQEMVNIH